MSIPAALFACRAASHAAISLLVFALAACSSGSGSGTGSSVQSPTPGVPFTVGTGCDLQYTLTDTPLLSGADPLFVNQWHLLNTGQSGGLAGEDIRATAAWALSKGDGIRVAVIDDSVELTHPDLQPNVVNGASRSYRPGNPYPEWPMPCKAVLDDHGTSVAGLLLARDGNGRFGSGVAPRASLVAFDALTTSYDSDIADALTRGLSTNAIYSNSWGSPDTGSTHAPPSSFINAIDVGLRTGRGGLGAVYVFPGGNGGCFREGEGGQCQMDNANLDGFSNQRGIVTVCAVNDYGRSPWYAEPGANLLVCAPSSDERPNFVGVTTTAIQASDRNDFSGTSASVPMVSGVVALMLSRNPSLSWRDVRIILADTARRNDVNSAGWLASSLGSGFHHKYGYGVVDAGAAVSKAATWQSVGGSARLITCDWVNGSNSLNVPDASPAGSGLALDDAVVVSSRTCPVTQIEFVEVRLTTRHEYTGDLNITLTSPLNRTSVLAEQRLCNDDVRTGDDCGAFSNWTFGSVRHMNEAAAGRWTLSIRDGLAGKSGQLVAWSLRIHGR